MARNWNSSETITVEARRLDDIIADAQTGTNQAAGPSRPLIKVDTEGEEGNVLLGAENTIRSLSPDFMIECFRTEACDQIDHAVQDRGYRLYRIIEAEHALVELDRMTPATLGSEKNFNTLVTARSPENLMDLIRQPMTVMPVAG